MGMLRNYNVNTVANADGNIGQESRFGGGGGGGKGGRPGGGGRGGA